VLDVSLPAEARQQVMHLFVAVGICGWKMLAGFFVAVFLKQKTGQKKRIWLSFPDKANNANTKLDRR
jgi:hypothetical protein